MKYIRTPFSIFEVVEETDIIYRVKAKQIPIHIYSKSKCQTNVIKSADTIEELCDEFVGISDGKPQMLRFVPYACAQFWNGGVYGAIWTDKGLIYVAKLNEKGKLELL